MEESNKALMKQNSQLTRKEFIQKYLIIFVLIAMFVVLTGMNSNFLTLNNILNLLTQTSIYGILALGLFIALVSKGIDLSVGSTLAFAGIMVGTISQTKDAVDKIFPSLGQSPLIVTIVLALIIGGVIGLINGSLIAYTGIPPFIATLGTQIAVRGAALMVSNGKPVSNINPQINLLGDRLFGFLPVPVLIYIAVIIFMAVLMNYTSFGKSIYAIGGNIEAAEISGIKVKRNIVLVYVISGVLAGISSLIYIGRTGGSIQPAAGTMYETTAIAAATIGGTSHSGGIGTVWGVVVGALILGTLTNGFTLLGIDAYVQQIIQGLIIVGAVVLDMRKNRKA
ncbi:ABC transporter permease [Vagococcus sp. BWB3-3]|uniref:ABC transporter permease n=1 Tax=Vagococcus allomyrinae TaxID=2794353 RepID=A0A940PCW8_9ENTE|nr:ABC transporter permease [Vagococcus allomyrinae]MBP1041196.1 ABC transporter permease [Vagococcus allomyrinae]